MNAAVRADDIVGRWGGEEFIVVAAQTDLAGASQLGERVRILVSETPIEVGDHTITVSVGCSSGTLAPEALIQQADEALYTSKTSGRNRVTPNPPPTDGRHDLRIADHRQPANDTDA